MLWILKVVDARCYSFECYDVYSGTVEVLLVIFFAEGGVFDLGAEKFLYFFTVDVCFCHGGGVGGCVRWWCGIRCVIFLVPWRSVWHFLVLWRSVGLC